MILKLAQCARSDNIAHIVAKVVTAASELPCRLRFEIPMITGGVVLIVNLPELKSKELKLDQKTLSDIFLGNIKVWNDPSIAALNPEVKLSNTKINVVRRSDSSGTTFIFTDYLSKISPEWKEKVGTGASVAWPVAIGGQKNPGVCNNVAKIKGSIGYTEYTYAVEAKIKCVTLKNKAGKFVAPTPKTFSASAGSADWETVRLVRPARPIRRRVTSSSVQSLALSLIRNGWSHFCPFLSFRKGETMTRNIYQVRSSEQVSR